MAAPASKSADQIVHDLDGMQRPGNNQGIQHKTIRRRSSMAKASLAPIKTDLKESLVTDDLKDVKMTRRRAARACDQCRRRKSRCDGQMHCSACKVVGLHCSYGHTIKQTRGPSYVAHLENKVDELEERLKTNTSPTGNGALPARSASQSPTFDSYSTAQCSPAISDWTGVPFTAKSSRSKEQCGLVGQFQGLSQQSQTAAYLTSITTEPRGFFGIDILRQLWNHCSATTSLNSDKSGDSSLKLVQALDAPLSIDTLPVQGAPLLPPKTQLIHWIGVAFQEVLTLFPFVDRASVQMVVYRLYGTNTFGQDANDKDELALLYALLALGQRFDTAKTLTAAEFRSQGLVFFAAARGMVPLQNCDRSLPALQTVLCLSLYLKAGSAVTRAHAFVSAAASAGLRIGLHEQVPCFAETEQTIRRRIWSTIRSLDVITSSLLGIPHFVTIATYDDDPFPSLTNGYEEDLVISSAHSRLITILGRAIDKTYSSNSAKKPMGLGSFAVREESMNDACNELDSWAQSCPLLATPIENMRKPQLLLAYSQAYVELILFSPFVHHLANSPGVSSVMEYTYAYRAFQAAVNAVKIAQVLHKRLWLNEAHGITLDTLAFAGVVLLTVEQTSAVNHLLVEAVQRSKQAKELLLLASLQNPAAGEVWGVLSMSETLMKNEGSQSFSTSAWKQTGTNMVLRREALPKRPATLVSQDSGVDVASPVVGCVNPSSLLSEDEAKVLSMPIGVDVVMG
ncbi:hypothetical protein M409DRAFT_59088 [Zasmidium cellare ATCC 36951]|uniref:Zn(2)-C6 fungal-type domain-containing protein n=1 Tax=Zasmidium cellare ATCC 36951 TaxID=1080233 RepID=A0A6A6C367_ZASCE|nr:uncharacterized protein M409DRAFT_59088 [Zasmidium cellare ATCC 36951]KAF2161373.1 hypothetical protein M409DRAFT_59088 [Zasmidium cellare ATCC 36951]